jgi:hypothetical protein
MAHYAFLDENDMVVEVIVGIDENNLIEGIDPEIWYGNFRNQVCKRTSYNGKIRKNFAGVGFTYNQTLDAFIAPEPENHDGFDEKSCQWIIPIVVSEIV